MEILRNIKGKDTEIKIPIYFQKFFPQMTLVFRRDTVDNVFSGKTESLWLRTSLNEIRPLSSQVFGVGEVNETTLFGSEGPRSTEFKEELLWTRRVP